MKDNPPIEPLQLATLAAQLKPEKPEDAFDRAFDVLEQAASFLKIKYSGDWVEGIEKKLSAGLPSGSAAMKKLVSRGLIRPSRGLRNPIFAATELQRFLHATSTSK